MTKVPETRPFLIQRNQHFEFFIFLIPFPLFELDLLQFLCSRPFSCQYARRRWETLLMSERHWKLINLFSSRLNWETYIADAKVVSGRQKCFCLQPKTFFVSEQQNLFPQHVSREAKLEICVRNNVSATMVPSLASRG